MSFGFEATEPILINCLVQGDAPPKKRALTVKIARIDNVSMLKEAIKSKLAPRFNHVVANELELWKVDVPLDGPNNKLAALEDDATVDIEQVLGGEEMLALCDIGEYFGDTHSKKHIHVIIKQCSPVETHHPAAVSPVNLPLNDTANPLESATDTSNFFEFDTTANVIGQYSNCVGECVFSNFIELESLVVDKSLFIVEFIQRSGRASLITRPPRFGKSTNLSMLAAFFAKPPKGAAADNQRKLFNRRKLFKGLRIARYTNFMDTHFAQYPVIHFSFKELDGKGIDIMYSSVNGLLSKLYKEHLYALDGIDPIYHEDFMNIVKEVAGPDKVAQAIAYLAKVLKMYHGKSCIILIDEYDLAWKNTLVNSSDSFTSFFKEMLLAVKDNADVFRLLVVGCRLLSPDSLGLNHLNHFPMNIVTKHSKRIAFSDAFGFTEEEVKLLLEKSGIEETMNNVRSWYGGYLTSTGTSLYNPHSIVKFLMTGSIASHWIETASDSALQTQLETRLNVERLDKLEMLYRHYNSTEVVSVFKMDLHPHLRSDDLIRPVDELLYYDGYFTVQPSENNDSTVSLIIPNKEIFAKWEKSISNIVFGVDGRRQISALYQSLADKNIGAFCSDFSDTFSQMLSKKYPGWTHQLWRKWFNFNVLLMFNSNYKIIYDSTPKTDSLIVTIIPPRTDCHVGFIFQIKEADLRDDLKSQSQRGLNQINEGHRRFAPIHLTDLLEFGIAFRMQQVHACARTETRVFGGWAKVSEAEGKTSNADFY
ncbi:hypothetical protein BC937DRAFT_86190 [Endogone sp. FLAS-F59071]|nr:hypothetical protein BC937DRAFT_86190 [Endogone sp. FLAS-F59071]|eukprot:RUS20202.1 hypothetical protein BC937DRAFT_86190 [Endogone sp. FLAS-F59071]